MAATGINKGVCPFDVACGPLYSGLAALSCGWAELWRNPQTLKKKNTLKRFSSSLNVMVGYLCKASLSGLECLWVYWKGRQLCDEIRLLGWLSVHLGYFSHSLVISVACLLCTWHITNFKDASNSIQSAVEKLLYFARLGSCRRPINQHFWWGLVFLWSYASAPGGVPWLHGYGRNARNAAKKLGFLQDPNLARRRSFQLHLSFESD